MIDLGRCAKIASLVGLLLAVRIAAAEPPSSIVRADWYFRESLGPIADWETILARLEGTVPAEELTAALPVPVDGEQVEWPNPIPLMLLPMEDRENSVGVRLEGDRVAVERSPDEDSRGVQIVAAGDTVVGYKHPGGGGKDQWYHAYHRRFDRLTTFAAFPAPFGIKIASPTDFRRGPNELTVELSSVVDEPIELDLQLEFHAPEASNLCGRKPVKLSGGATQSLRFSVELGRAGGSFLMLTVAAAERKFRIPLFAHVENTDRVLDGIERILADRPDAESAKQAALLRTRANQWSVSSGPSATDSWRSLFEEASRLRDRLLLERIDFDTLLFVKRKPYFSEQPFMDAHHLFNRPGGGIYRLSPVRPDGKVTPVVDGLGEGVYRDVCLHFNGERFLFAFGNGSDKWDGSQSYHIYEASIDGSSPRQLTSGPRNDCEAFYMGDGKIGFTSDRSDFFVMCGGNRHSPTLFVMEADGSNPRQLSFNVFNDFNPTMLPDGRILYSRWEYNERSVTSLHNPFTMNPDGTMVSPYYGNATIRPNVVMFPRPVPNSRQVTALFTAHHGQTHGSIGLIDVRLGIDGPEPLAVLTPGVPITGEKAEDSRVGWYSDPVPLSESTYLCSYTPTVLPWLERSWALYVGDRHGNLALVYRDAEISCAEPVPLVARKRPHVRGPASVDTDSASSEATLLMSSVYVGLPDVERGAARYLRVLEDLPRKGVTTGGVIVTSGTLIFTVKRILGSVPIESDGSAHFVVPANRNVYFEVLDAEGREIQRMRSVVCLKPGETRGCIGCHERRTMAPPDVTPAAFTRGPDRPVPPPWGTQVISFLRDVQPVLNDHCVECHTHDRMENRVILTDDLTDQFNVAYEELLPHLSVAISNRWDHPDDVLARPAYTFGSKTSALSRLLDAGHHGVELSHDDWNRLGGWIDANGVYYDRYEHNRGPKRRIFDGPVRKELEDVLNRRCADCHSRGDGQFDTWWMSINRRDVTKSRALAAPLARSAGGWGRCGPAVFADTDDPDYRSLLRSLGMLAKSLGENPRVDLVSISGTAAESQAVKIPPPPEPRTTDDAAPMDGDWVYLSNLKWESAQAGWTRNGDGLPSLDRDVTNNLLKLGTRRYRKGIGTHAPSEIVYEIGAGYSRFLATVGGAEEKGTVVFQVFGDGKLLAQTGVMQGMRGVEKIDVATAGVRRLRLVVTDAGDNYYSDMANWADARLVKSQ